MRILVFVICLVFGMAMPVIANEITETKGCRNASEVCQLLLTGYKAASESKERYCVFYSMAIPDFDELCEEAKEQEPIRYRTATTCMCDNGCISYCVRD